MNFARGALLAVFDRLLEHFGPLHWWPGDSRFEIMVGAVLTQNTAWSNVEKAIANLRGAGVLDLETMRATAPDTLAELIRPAGYFNVKQHRLRNLLDWLHANGGIAALDAWTSEDLRTGLLSVHGVGPETADDIVLYACDRPVFVIDAYSRRLFSRFGWIDGDEPYDSLRLAIETALGPDVALFNEYHAQIVYLGKDFCRPKPRCVACPLRTICPYPTDRV